MAINDRLDYIKMKARHQKQLLAWYKKPWGIVLIIALSIILLVTIFSVFYIFNKVQEIRLEEEVQNHMISQENYLKAIKGDGTNYYLGAEKSNKDEDILEITIFSNYSCYYSALSYLDVKKLANSYGDKVRFIHRDYPGPDSIILSLAARCAGEQNKFWEMSDFLFELQDEFSSIIDDDEKRYALLEMADILKLNLDSFTTCLDDQKYLSKVRKDYEDGELLAIPGTPTWFIDGVDIVGGLSESRFEELLLGLGYIK